jgi:hypothetical protein
MLFVFIDIAGGGDTLFIPAGALQPEAAAFPYSTGDARHA